jgi:predicted dehydrogenase
MREFRIGLIGAGAEAEGHLRALQWLSPTGVVVSAVADRDVERARAFAQAFGVGAYYSSMEEMLSAESLHALVVAGPPAMRAVATITGLETGHHVLCETPPSASVAETGAMADAARANARVLRFAYHYEFMVQEARRVVDAGDLGAIESAHAVWMRGRGEGGALTHMGAHLLATTLSLLRSPQASYVSGRAWTGTTYPLREGASAVIDLVNGPRLTLEVASGPNVGVRDQAGITLNGLERTMTIPLLTRKDQVPRGLEPVLYGERGGGPHEQRLAQPPTIEQCQMEQMAVFVEAARTGALIQAWLDVGPRVRRLVDAIYTSAARGGQQVDIRPSAGPRRSAPS